MSADVALNRELMKIYPFCRLSEPANVLVMPALHSAHISSNLCEELDVGTVIGPILVGMEKSVQIVSMNASVADMINLAAIASVEAIHEKGHHAPRKPRKSAVLTLEKAKKTT
jgi:malate dehydrogenase (oxaloacetate-decarboxylating)(NADP+)